MAFGYHQISIELGGEIITSLISDGLAHCPLWLFDRRLTTSLECPHFANAVRLGIWRRYNINDAVVQAIMTLTSFPSSLVPLIMEYALYFPPPSSPSSSSITDHATYQRICALEKRLERTNNIPWITPTEDTTDTIADNTRSRS
jgi:hypothetical protein